MGDGGGRRQISGLRSLLGHILCTPDTQPGPQGSVGSATPLPKTLSGTEASRNLPLSFLHPCQPRFHPAVPPLAQSSSFSTLLWNTSFQGAHPASTSSSHLPPPVSPLPSLEHKRNMRKASVWALGGEG